MSPSGAQQPVAQSAFCVQIGLHALVGGLIELKTAQARPVQHVSVSRQACSSLWQNMLGQ